MKNAIAILTILATTASANAFDMKASLQNAPIYNVEAATANADASRNESRNASLAIARDRHFAARNEAKTLCTMGLDEACINQYGDDWAANINPVKLLAFIEINTRK